MRSVACAVVRTLLLLLPALFVTGCGDGAVTEPQSLAPTANFRALDLRAGTRFIPARHFEAPAVSRIELPQERYFDSIWGATGRDDDGRIYVGVSSHGGDLRTARLYQYDPSTGVLRQQSDVLSELRRSGLFRVGQGQNKLHSKFVPADDGYLYFSSFDEQGEDASTNPRWGGHLWRKRPHDTSWEHLLATPEALIAVNGTGRYVYALGYWDHVLYVYDTATGRHRSVMAGSVPGHVSRNFLVDFREHAYVPEVTRTASGGIAARLNEYDPDLKLISSTALPAYGSDKMSANEGIVAHALLSDERIAFIAGKGELYVLSLSTEGTTRLEHRGKFHPEGGNGTKSLFSFNGNSLLAGVSRKPKSRGKWEWVIYELESDVSATAPLHLGISGSKLIYGSFTRDNDGNFYVAGRLVGSGSRSSEPLLLRLEH